MRRRHRGEQERVEGLDGSQVAGRDALDVSLGYLKPTSDRPFGSAANAALGTPGNGGSFGLAEGATGTGYCYAPNRLGFGLIDQREIVVRDALYHDVPGERSQQPARP